MSLALIVCALVIGVLVGADLQFTYLKRMKQAGPSTSALQNSNPHVSWGRTPKLIIYFPVYYLFFCCCYGCVFLFVVHARYWPVTLLSTYYHRLSNFIFLLKREKIRKSALNFFKEGLNGTRNA